MDPAHLLEGGHQVAPTALAKRAAIIDPRSATALGNAANLAMPSRRFNDANRYGDALILLDSTDEPGWRIQVYTERLRGDTLAMQCIVTLALKRIPSPLQLPKPILHHHRLPHPRNPSRIIRNP